MNIMALIELLDDELTNASNLPLTGKKLVDVDKCLDIISDLRINLPDDIKDAERIVQEKNQILNDAHQEAQNIISEAERRFNQILDEHEITVHAHERADAIVAAAEAEAREVKLGAIGYATDILDIAQKNAARTLEEIEKSRSALDAMSKREE